MKCGLRVLREIDLDLKWWKGLKMKGSNWDSRSSQQLVNPRLDCVGEEEEEEGAKAERNEVQVHDQIVEPTAMSQRPSHLIT